MSTSGDVAFVDFETKGIEARPQYPPEPVGVAIEAPRQPPEYLAWGHPTDNNTTKEKAIKRLQALWGQAAASRLRLCFHNAKFDLDVGEVHLGLALPPPLQVEDTGILGFFDDPRAFSHRLKDLAKNKLGIQPDERDELKAWVLANCKAQLGRKTKNWGAYMWMAPGSLVGRYAKADIRMTKELFEHYDKIRESMLGAYDRERQLVYVLLDMERHGVNVDVPLLRRDVQLYDEVLVNLDQWIKRRLGAPAELNIDSDTDLATWLEEAGVVSQWVLTEKGNRSVSAEALDASLTDRELFGALQYRGTLSTCLGTFMKNWLASGEQHGGVVYVEWNQFKDRKGLGTKSGRLSSSPNFQNIPTELEAINKARPSFCPPLPVCRRYITAPKGWVVVSRDYNSQEYRLFAHYEDGQLAQAYREDPWRDIHLFVTNLINEAIGSNFSRKSGKTINFGILYGQGIRALAAMLKCSVEEAKSILDTYLNLLPGVKDIRSQMDARDHSGDPITTIGGRIYYPEPPMLVKDKFRGGMRWQRFGYKLVNLLIQAGAADYSKQAMINYHFRTKKHGRLIMQVHDELVAIAPAKHAKAELKQLKIAMEDMNIKLDVPMLSEGSFGPNFADLEDLPRGQ